MEARRENVRGQRRSFLRKSFGLVLAMGVIVFGASAEDAGEAQPTPIPAPPGALEFVGKNFFATANGVFQEWHVVENGLDPNDFEEGFVVVEVALASVFTDSNRRDDHLRSADFFEVETFPVARVRVHSARRVGENAMGHSLYSASFDIDLHGVQKTLEGELELIGLDPVVAQGRLEIDRLDFRIGSPPSRWNPMSIERNIPIRFRVEL